MVVNGTERLSFRPKGSKRLIETRRTFGEKEIRRMRFLSDLFEQFSQR